MAVVALLPNVPPASAQSHDSCAVLWELAELQRDIRAARLARTVPVPSPTNVKFRLGALDRDALERLQPRDPTDSIGRLIVILSEFAATQEVAGVPAAMSRLEAPDYRIASDGLKRVADRLSCDIRQAMRTPMQAGSGLQEPSDTKTYLGSKRATATYEYSYMLQQGYVVVPPVALAVAIAIFLGIRLSRKARRLRRKYTCNVVVHVVGEHDVDVGTMLDVSRRGGKVMFTHPPELGTKVRLQWDSVWHDATVHWSNHFCSGLRFLKPIDGRTLRVIRRLSDAHLAELEAAEHASSRIAGPEARPPGPREISV